MKTNNHSTLSKHIVVKNLQSMKVHKFEIWDLTSSKDRKDLLNELEKKMRKGYVSVILIEGDQ
jgi:hypothetical protein